MPQKGAKAPPKSTTVPKASKKRKVNPPLPGSDFELLEHKKEEIQKFLLLNLSPAQMAERLQKGGHFIDPKTISDKITFWKRNGTITIPPLVPGTPTNKMFVFFFFLSSIGE
jgi:hypothetical protein